MFSRAIHVAANGWVIFHCVYIYHILLHQLSVDGHLGCFHVLAIINNAAMNMGCMYLFELEFLSFQDICPGMGLLDSNNCSIFSIFKEPLFLFSIVTVPFYIPTNSVWRFPLLHSLSSIYYLQTFMMAILTGMKGCLSAVLLRISVVISDVEHFFMCLWLSVCVLWRNVYLSLVPIFLLSCLSLLILSCMSCLCILEIKPFNEAFMRRNFEAIKYCIPLQTFSLFICWISSQQVVICSSHYLFWSSKYMSWSQMWSTGTL